MDQFTQYKQRLHDGVLAETIRNGGSTFWLHQPNGHNKLVEIWSEARKEAGIPTENFDAVFSFDTFLTSVFKGATRH